MALKIPPVLLAIIAGLLMWLMAALTPGLAFAVPGRKMALIALSSLSGLLAGPSIASVLRAKTTLSPTRPERASALLCSGVYAISRNPMYLSLAVLLAAWAVFLSNPLTMFIIPGFIAYMNRFQIEPEERALTTLFGDEYLAYQKKVRRWL